MSTKPFVSWNPTQTGAGASALAHRPLTHAPLEVFDDFPGDVDAGRAFDAFEPGRELTSNRSSPRLERRNGLRNGSPAASTTFTNDASLMAMAAGIRLRPTHLSARADISRDRGILQILVRVAARFLDLAKRLAGGPRDIAAERRFAFAYQPLAVAVGQNAIQVFLRIEQLDLIGLRHRRDRTRFLQQSGHCLNVGIQASAVGCRDEFIATARLH